VRALDLASRTLLHSEHPDAIEARVVLLELCEMFERYERPSVAPLIRVKPAPNAVVKLEGIVRQCLWCGRTIDPDSQPRKLFCCRNHRQRGIQHPVPIAGNRTIAERSQGFCNSAAE
jgi:hypothetical protein